MKFKFILALGVLAAITAPAALWVYQVHRPRISLECYEKIQEGMTQAQVEEILGGPPRWEIEAKRPMDEIIYHIVISDLPAQWWGRAGVITVFYDNTGSVRDKAFKKLPFERKPRSFWDCFP